MERIDLTYFIHGYWISLIIFQGSSIISDELVLGNVLFKTRHPLITIGPIYSDFIERDFAEHGLKHVEYGSE